MHVFAPAAMLERSVTLVGKLGRYGRAQYFLSAADDPVDQIVQFSHQVQENYDRTSEA